MVEPVFIIVGIGLTVLVAGFIIACCCKNNRRHQGTVFTDNYYGGTGVTVTTQHVASPVVVPPYPVDSHPRPPGFATHTPPYPTHPAHPVPGACAPGGPAPYPPMGGAPYPPTGPPPGATPYPPPPTSNSSQPPSYFEAVGQPPTQPLTQEVYSKQSPYNPSFS